MPWLLLAPGGHCMDDGAGMEPSGRRAQRRSESAHPLTMDRALELLRGLGACPATPFFEGLPAQYISQTLLQVGVEHWRDEFGNVVAHVRATGESSQPPVAFVAHMDHPGFEIVEIEGTGAVARAMGGVPAASLTKPCARLRPRARWDKDSRRDRAPRGHDRPERPDLGPPRADQVGRGRRPGAALAGRVRSCGLRP